MKDRTLTSIMGLLAILAGTTCSPANADVPALKDVFAQDFLIGGALNDRLVSGKDPNAAATETQMKLAEKYAEIFSVLLKHKKAVSRVTFWGVYDATSWIGGSPLLFDRKCQPKLAYFAVVKTAQDNK